MPAETHQEEGSIRRGEASSNRSASSGLTNAKLASMQTSGQIISDKCNRALTSTVGDPIRLILPLAKVPAPPNEKKVTISPGPSSLWIVVMAVVEGFRPTE